MVNQASVGSSPAPRNKASLPKLWLHGMNNTWITVSVWLMNAKNLAIVRVFHPQSKNQQFSIQPHTFTTIICDFERPNTLPFLHRGGLNPCTPPAQRTDSTPSCAWSGTSLIGNRALIWTLRVLLDSSQKNTGKELLAAENGRTPLCPTSSFFFFLFPV